MQVVSVTKLIKVIVDQKCDSNPALTATVKFFFSMDGKMPLVHRESQKEWLTTEIRGFKRIG